MIKKMQHVVPVLTSQMFFVTFVVNRNQNRKPIKDVVKNAYMKYFGMQTRFGLHILPAKPSRSTYDNELRGMESNSNFIYP